MVELIIFDCDGVLVDSETIAARVSAEMLQELGATISAEEVMTAFVGLDADVTRKRIEADYGIILPPGFDERSAAALEMAFSAELKALAGVEDVLRLLEAPYCVASNSGHSRLRHTFKAAGLSSLVDGRVFSADDVRRGKPAPDLFLHAAACMGGVPAERCLVIEDSITGVTAARSAGMRVIGFCGGSHIRAGHAQRLLTLGAEGIVMSFKALEQFLPLSGTGPLRRTA